MTSKKFRLVILIIHVICIHHSFAQSFVAQVTKVSIGNLEADSVFSWNVNEALRCECLSDVTNLSFTVAMFKANDSLLMDVISIQNIAIDSLFILCFDKVFYIQGFRIQLEEYSEDYKNWSVDELGIFDYNLLDDQHEITTNAGRSVICGKDFYPVQYSSRYFVNNRGRFILLDQNCN